MLKGKRPLERTKVRHWKTLELKKGNTLVGYIAGDAIVVEAHTCRKSKPCLKAYRGESIECVGCTQMIRKCSIAYQPFYCAITDRPTVAVFHEDMFARLDGYKLHQKVTLGRPDGENPGLWIRSEKGKYEGTSTAHQGNADICEWLVCLWRMSGVITAEQIRCGPSEPADLTKNSQETAAPVTAVDKAYEKLPIDVRKRMQEMFAERSRQGLEPIPFSQLLEQMGHANGVTTSGEG